jgi:hypothetical protein
MRHVEGKRRGGHRVLVGKSEGKRSLRRHRLRWEDNMRMDLREIGRERMWTVLIWLRIATSGGLWDSGSMTQWRTEGVVWGVQTPPKFRNFDKVPKIKKIWLCEMKFLLPNYGCLQNPWLGGHCPPIPVLSVLNWICWTPPPKQNSWVRHCHDVRWFSTRWKNCWVLKKESNWPDENEGNEEGISETSLSPAGGSNRALPYSNYPLEISYWIASVCTVKVRGKNSLS